MVWNKGDIGVLVCSLPGRKRPVLCLRRGDKVAKVGFLNSEDDAKAFQMFMDLLADNGEKGA